jgi:6-phosphogluconolactonase
MTTRRELLAGLVATGTLATLPVAARSPRPALVAGTYAGKGGGGLYLIDPTATGWQVGDPIGKLTDLSFGVSHGYKSYFVHESPKGRLIATDRAGGILTDLASGGDDPCHVAIDRRTAMLAVANYSSGSVAVYPLNRNGIPGAPTVRQQRGTGPRTNRQSGPHAHWVGFTPDSRYLHAVDLGADAVFAYTMRGAIPSQPRVAWQAPAGSGPRHLARHPRLPVAYVVTELANTLLTLTAKPDGSFTTRSSQSLLPRGFTGESYAAHIALDRAGRRLYASNRGHDSIAVFDLGVDGTPRPIQHIACGGDWPRFFLLLEDAGLLLVANERSGNVAVFRIGPDGRLTATGETLAIPGVVFLDRA